MLYAKYNLDVMGFVMETVNLSLEFYSMNPGSVETTQRDNIYSWACLCVYVDMST